MVCHRHICMREKLVYTSHWDGFSKRHTRAHHNNSENDSRSKRDTNKMHTVRVCMCVREWWCCIFFVISIEWVMIISGMIRVHWWMWNTLTKCYMMCDVLPSHLHLSIIFFVLFCYANMCELLNNVIVPYNLV